MDGFDAERGRRFLGGCFAIVALPFFIAGVNVLGAGVRALHRGEAHAVVLVGAGIAFTAFSLGIVALSWFGIRQAQALAQRRGANPMQPWLWRDDWSARRVTETSRRPGAALLLFAV